MASKPLVFIGSSSERLSVARAIELNLDHVANSTIWAHAFSPGRSVYEDLLEQASRFDYAIIVMGADDKVLSRGEEQAAPRDNVVFELGLFLGALGRERVFAVIDKSSPSKIMSDYKNVTYIPYDGSRLADNPASALSPASTQIMRVIEKLGKSDKSSEINNYLFPGDLIGLERIFDNFDSARTAIFDDIRTTSGMIRIFIHIASQDVSQKGTFFDVLEEVAKEGKVDIRVLHAGRSSPLFDRDRLISLGKDPSRVLRSLEWASDSLQMLERLQNSPLRRRSHSFPFIWRMYGVADRLYVMPYFADKDAVRSSPVLVFRRAARSMYNVFRDWFDHSWQSATPETASIGEIVSPASPAGAALILKWEGRHVFGIPRRDLGGLSNSVRFYGIGGKRESGLEDFVACALREAEEELGDAVEALEDASVTTYVRSDGTSHEISVSGLGTRPRLIMEKANSVSFATSHGDYTLVAFEGRLREAPRPKRELAAVLLLTDRCLERFLTSSAVSLREILALGGELFVQPTHRIDDDVTLIPHGTAAFLIRNMVHTLG